MSSITGVTRATTVGELMAALQSPTSGTTASPTSAPAKPASATPATPASATPATPASAMGLSSGTVPSTYVKYPTYAGQIPSKTDISTTNLVPGTPPNAKDRGTGSGSVRNAYYIATTAAKGATSPTPGNPITTGPLIGWPVVITGGAIPAGSVFRTTIDSFHILNSMTWDGYRYGTFTFSPEPPAPKGSYNFFFAPTIKGGRRRRGSKRSGSKRRGRKGTRRAF